MSNDRSVALNGGIWTGISTAVTLVATFARVMILTRFLEKSDFGVVSIINMVIGLCTTFTDLGFASVIMYKQKLTDKEFSSLFWTQLILFSFIYLILWGLAPLFSSFYEEPSLSVLIPIASLSVICQAFGKLYDSVLQKQYQFKLLAFRNIISNFASLILAGWMAWAGYGVYSLVFSTLCQVVILNLWNFLSGIKMQKVRFMYDFMEILPLIKIGVYQTGTRILDFFSNKLDVMIIGKLLGTEALGLYDLAKELVYKLVDLIRIVVSKVALPILSNNNSNEDAVRNKFLMITKTVATLCIPICVTVAVFSEDVVHIVYGESYIEMAPLVSIFSVITMFTSISSFFDMLGIAKGRTDLNFRNTIYRVLMTTPMIFVCSLWSITAVAIGQLIVTLCMFFVFWSVVVQKTYPMSLKEYFAQFDHVLYLTVAIALVVCGIRILVSDKIGGTWVFSMIIFGLIYSLLLISSALIFLQKEIKFFANLLKGK